MRGFKLSTLIGPEPRGRRSRRAPPAPRRRRARRSPARRAQAARRGQTPGTGQSPPLPAEQQALHRRSGLGPCRCVDSVDQPCDVSARLTNQINEFGHFRRGGRKSRDALTVFLRRAPRIESGPIEALEPAAAAGQSDASSPRDRLDGTLPRKLAQTRAKWSKIWTSATPPRISNCPPTTAKASLCACSRGKTIVLYFYPKDDTSGCTAEAIAFNALRDKFDAAGAVVLGVSPDSAASHAKFKRKHDLKLTLAADERKATLEAYGVWRRKEHVRPPIYGGRTHHLPHRRDGPHRARLAQGESRRPRRGGSGGGRGAASGVCQRLTLIGCNRALGRPAMFGAGAYGRMIVASFHAAAETASVAVFLFSRQRRRHPHVRAAPVRAVVADRDRRDFPRSGAARRRFISPFTMPCSAPWPPVRPKCNTPTRIASPRRAPNSTAWPAASCSIKTPSRARFTSCCRARRNWSSAVRSSPPWSTKPRATPSPPRRRAPPSPARPRAPAAALSAIGAASPLGPSDSVIDPSTQAFAPPAPT